MLFYIKLVKYLEEYGFGLNLYGPCVEKKTVNGKQMTATSHLERLMVSHVYLFKIMKFSIYLSNIYGVLSVHQGKVHNYLGMDIDYSDNVKVKFAMVKYLNNVLKIS